MQHLLLWWLLSVAWGRERGRILRPSRDVTTSAGVARGYLTDQHYAFLGVPYARMPKQPRFKAPEPPKPWDGIFEAIHRVKCPQPDGEGEENCLVVNVYVPKVEERDCCPLGVLVHLHGGGFISGWGAHHPPPRFLDEFVIVTFNYRLGALGFLCLGTQGAPGNAGLKDQVAALYWIKNNIANFGGNPQDVTVYATGSGATSLQLLLLSGMTKDLFHRVILESGSALSPTALAYDPFANGLEGAVAIGHEDLGDPDDLERFYQEVSVTDIVNTSAVFIPCVENHYLFTLNLIDQDPLEALKSGNYHKVPMILIYTNAEQIDVIDKDPEKFHDVPDNFEEVLPINLEFAKAITKIKLAELIRNSYFKDVLDGNVVTLFMEYVNDVFMEYPVIKFSTLYAANSQYPVYVMKFSYSSTTDDHGTKFGDVRRYIFSKDLEEEDELAVNRLDTMLKSFMKMGDPTPLTTSLVPVVWQPITARQKDNLTDISKSAYLIFGRNLGMNAKDTSQSLVFWDHIYSRFYRTHKFVRNATEDDDDFLSNLGVSSDTEGSQENVENKISREVEGPGTSGECEDNTEAEVTEPATTTETEAPVLNSVASYLIQARKSKQ